MSARGGVLTAIAGLFVEPIDRAPVEAFAGEPASARVVVAVIGLSPRCGATTVARALGAELALRDDGSCVVTAETVAAGGIPLGTPAAVRLTRALSRAVAERMRPVGRLCLATCGAGSPAALVDAARDAAPVVLDVFDPSQASVAASLADAVVLVAGPGTEPALAAVAAESLARVGPDSIVVLNRDRGDSDRWHDRHAIALPDSRLGAQLALAGREPPAALGQAISTLADLVTGR